MVFTVQGRNFIELPIIGRAEISIFATSKSIIPCIAIGVIFKPQNYWQRNGPIKPIQNDGVSSCALRHKCCQIIVGFIMIMDPCLYYAVESSQMINQWCDFFVGCNLIIDPSL